MNSTIQLIVHYSALTSNQLRNRNEYYYKPFFIKENMHMLKMQIITSTTRPGRNGKAVADWVLDVARRRGDIEFELVDIKDFDLPLFDEPVSPAYGEPTQEHTRKWQQKIAEADGYIMVTAEYNHSVPGALKNAIDYAYSQWNNKAVGFVGYGSHGGSRAIEHLRGIAGELQLADVRESVMLSLFTDFENMSTFKPAASHEERLNLVIDQVSAWSAALQPLHG